jgi:Fe-Mn family superoxide dismutase
MTYSPPRLPYSDDALEPVISQRTVLLHYGEHVKSYINNLNRLIKGTQFEDSPLEEVIENSTGPLFNNAAQVWNHIFYFFSFSPDGGGKPDGEISKAIDRDFGSFDNFKKVFVDAAATLFGSGWVWLSRDNNRRLFITQGQNAANPLTDGLTPLLAFDVWEHAYYIDYENRRADYLERLWEIVDWDMVENRF